MVVHNGVECTTQDEIEATILENSYNKYRKTNHTPFMNEPITTDFGYNGDIPNTDAVLDGTYNPPLVPTSMLKGYYMR